jgi:signal transduction histidine kinase
MLRAGCKTPIKTQFDLFSTERPLYDHDFISDIGLISPQRARMQLDWRGYMASMAEFSPMSQAPETNILPEKRPEQVISRSEMLGRRYEALSRLSRSLGCGTPEDWIRELTAGLRGLLRFDLLEVIVYKNGTNEVQWRSPALKQACREEVPSEETLFWYVYAHQQALWIADCNTDEGCAVASQRLKKLQFGYRSFYGTPLSTPHCRLGVFGVASSQPNSSSSEDLEFLGQVASQLALAIDNWVAHRDIADLQDRVARGGTVAPTDATVADLAHTNRVSMLGELAASIAHEVNQPLAGIVSGASASLRWLSRDVPNVEEACAAVRNIVRDGKRASEIIHRLRSLYKKTPPKRELIDVNEIIGEMVVMLRSEANRFAVSIRTDLAADLPRITADGVQLQQVLMNLMLNGIEAMNEAGGVLTVKSQPEDRHVVISVSDTGVGLPPAKAGRIFDAFFTTKPQGSGMGLAISRSIIESHGGRLWATPNDGRGASFRFSLPTAMHEEETLPRQTENIRLRRYSP